MVNLNYFYKFNLFIIIAKFIINKFYLNEYGQFQFLLQISQCLFSNIDKSLILINFI